MVEFTPALIGKAAGVISFIAFVPYIISILRGKTKPSRSTWWIWTLVGGMIGTSYYSSGATHTIWVPVSYVIGPFIVAILAMKYGEGNLVLLDGACLIGTGLSLIAWCAFSSPFIALAINVFVDFLGALPTIRKTYYDPESESPFAWIVGFTANVVNLFAIEYWEISIFLYPVYMVTVTGVITVLTLRGRFTTKHITDT